MLLIIELAFNSFEQLHNYVTTAEQVLIYRTYKFVYTKIEIIIDTQLQQVTTCAFFLRRTENL